MGKFLLGFIIGGLSIHMMCYYNMKDYNNIIKSQKPFGLQIETNQVYQCKSLNYARNIK